MTNIDDVWKRDEVDSPCVKLCVLHTTAKICVGCFRTAEEIENWTAMGAEKRRDIMATLPERSRTLKTRRKKRASRQNIC